jgi:hypothetical protein
VKGTTMRICGGGKSAAGDCARAAAGAASATAVKRVASERSVIVLPRAGSREFTSANEGDEVRVTR